MVIISAGAPNLNKFLLGQHAVAAATADALLDIGSGIYVDVTTLNAPGEEGADRPFPVIGDRWSLIFIFRNFIDKAHYMLARYRVDRQRVKPCSIDLKISPDLDKLTRTDFFAFFVEVFSD